MATAFKSGRSIVIQWVDDDNKRWTIRPGTGDRKTGEQFARRIERLQTCVATGSAPVKDLALWIESLPEKTRHKLVSAGLLGERAAIPTLGQYLDRYLKLRTTDGTKSTTLAKFEQTAESLKEKLEAGTRLDRIAPTDATDWRAWFAGRRGRKSETVSESTVAAITRCSKTMFAAAAREKLISSSPFAHLSGTSPKVDKDWHYVSLGDLQKLLAVCDTDWCVLFTLCRLAGLRRGEALRLRWADVDWNERRLSVLPEGGMETTKQRRRVVPIEPELHAILLEAFDQAADGQDLVVNVDAGNVDIMARRRIRWAGFDVWSKPFHTLRKNRATDWAQQYPQYVVAEWMGHSIEVSANNYLKVPEELYQKAAESAAESAAVMRRNAVQGVEKSKIATVAANHKINVTDELATSCIAFQEYPRQGSNLQPSAPEADALSN